MRVPADESMLPELLAVVRGHDENGVVVETFTFQEIQDSPKAASTEEISAS